MLRKCGARWLISITPMPQPCQLSISPAACCKTLSGSVAGPVVSGLLISVAGYDGLLMTLFVSGALFLLIQCLGKSEKALLADEREREEEMDDISEAAQ